MRRIYEISLQSPARLHQAKFQKSKFAQQESSPVAAAGGHDKPRVSSAELTMTVLLKSLKCYQCWLPEALSDASFDAGKLLTQVSALVSAS